MSINVFKRPVTVVDVFQALDYYTHLGKFLSFLLLTESGTGSTAPLAHKRLMYNICTYVYTYICTYLYIYKYLYLYLYIYTHVVDFFYFNRKEEHRCKIKCLQSSQL